MADRAHPDVVRGGGMNNTTLLHRQVNPNWIQEGRVTSQVFSPTPKDQERVSVYDADQITAEKSWQHFTGHLGHASVGVLSVTVEECHTIELSVEADPIPFQEHTVIKFEGFTKSQIKAKAKQLTQSALSRGWQYRAETDS